MSDPFSSIELGLERLLSQLRDRQLPTDKVLVYQHRLHENISAARLYGDTESRRADRAQVVGSLNLTALETIGEDFNALCKEDWVSPYINLPPDNSSNHLPTMLLVAPLDRYFPQNDPPLQISTPHTYKYLGELDGLSSHHFYRDQDQHVALLFTSLPGVLKSFLIDKYAITCRQFSIFLNDLIEQGKIRTEKGNIYYCVDLQDRPLIFDALNRWQRGPTHQEPWLHIPDPWGVTYQNGQWQPVSGSDLLPVTLVTWWGARLYSLWAHRQPINADDKLAYLPTIQQWQMATLWHASTRRLQRYPWGDAWRREHVNYAGYWADREVLEVTWLSSWAKRADIYCQTRPLPVASLDEGRSPIGCVQMLGNVWEWCSDPPPNKPITMKAVKGGACLSPQEYCAPNWEVAWRPEQGNEYIGFRCCLSLTD